MQTGQNRMAMTLLLLSAAVSAQEEETSGSHGFRLGFDLGVGALEREIGDFDADDTTFYMGFSGAYRFSEHVLAGLEIDGWLLEASNLNDPTVGEGISRIFLFAQIYPSAQTPWFLKLSGGYASHWNRRPGEPGKSSGDGYELGIGYDYAMQGYGRWSMTP